MVAAVCVKCCKNHPRPTMTTRQKMRTKGDEEMPGTSVATMHPRLFSPSLTCPLTSYLVPCLRSSLTHSRFEVREGDVPAPDPHTEANPYPP